MCGLEFPDLEIAIWRRYRDRGVLVIGVDPGGLMDGEDTALIEQFAAHTGVTFPLGLDAGGSYRAFRGGDAISPFPLDVIVAPDGTIAYQSREYDRAGIEATLDRLLDRQ